MEQISQEQFSEYMGQLKEMPWAVRMRETHFQKLKQSPYPSFKYGLNINVQPFEFNFDSVIPKIPEHNRIVLKYSRNAGIEVIQGSSLGIIGKTAIPEAWKPFFQKKSDHPPSQTGGLLALRPQTGTLDLPFGRSGRMSKCFAFLPDQFFLRKNNLSKHATILDGATAPNHQSQTGWNSCIEGNSFGGFFPEGNAADGNEGSKLTHFHQAFANDFLFIRIPKFSKIVEPIEVIYEINDGPLLSSIFILAEPGAKATLLLYKASKQATKHAYHSETIRVIAKESSSVEIITIQDLGREMIQIQDKKGIIEKDAALHWADACIGTKYTKSEIANKLSGPGSNGTIKVFFLGAGNQRFDLNTSSIHAAPRTVSDILTKGALTGEAKALSRGLVRIEENAPGSNGYEKQDALLLSDKAEADAIPHLEINNHDVRCTHGSTVGQIDREKMFYLMSRGLDEQAAKKLIIEGYFTPALDMFNNKAISEKVHHAIIGAIA